jgi:hypothetical protein
MIELHRSGAKNYPAGVQTRILPPFARLAARFDRIDTHAQTGVGCARQSATPKPVPGCL